MKKTIWVPDGEAVRVEWYVSGGKAVGVNEITEDWIPRPIDSKRQTGFVEPDIPRDDLVPPEARRK